MTGNEGSPRSMFRDLPLAERLLLTERGTALFARLIADLDDAGFAEPSSLDGWSRAHLIGHVGYNATGMGHLLDWAATGVETPMYPSVDERNREINEGATAAPDELRELYSRTAAQLDEKWRSLPEAAWSAKVRTMQGIMVPAETTVWMRAREVWIHAVDLGVGTTYADFPGPVLRSLLDNLVSGWRRAGWGAGITLAVTGEDPIEISAGEPSGVVSGDLAAVASWATGRGSDGVSGDPVLPDAPKWL